MVNILKIVFLGLVGFSLLVFLTADKPKNISKKADVLNIIKYDALPKTFIVVGEQKIILREDIIRNEPTLIVVGNHDSLGVINEIPKYFDVKIPLVLVANISSAPWLIKETLISSRLDELNQENKNIMINDSDGNLAKSLKLYDNTKTKYFAYLLSNAGTISKVYEGFVKDGAIDGTMNKEEKIKALEPLTKYLK